MVGTALNEHTAATGRRDIAPRRHWRFAVEWLAGIAGIARGAFAVPAFSILARIFASQREL